MSTRQARAPGGRVHSEPPDDTRPDEPVVDAEVVDDHHLEPNGNGHAASVALERPRVTNEVLMPLDTAEVVEGMRAYQELLKQLLEPSDWQSEDRNGRRLDRPFPKKSAWRKIARAFNLSVVRVSESVERDDDGHPLRAHAVYRAIAPNGTYQDGDGYCSAEESRFTSWRGRQKLENDLRATATTRAKNRAIADLVGMGEVSAEEMEMLGGASVAGQEATPQSKARASRALTSLVGDDAALAEQTWGETKAACGGTIAESAAQALILAARSAQAHRQERRATAEPRRESGPLATAAQQRKAMAAMREAGLVDRQLQRAIVEWVAEVEHLDRLPKASVTPLLAAIEDHEGTLAELSDAAAGGDERARRIAGRLDDGEER